MRNLSLRRRPGRPTRWGPGHLARIEAGYAAGRSTHAIAQDFGVTSKTINNVCHRYGLKPNPYQFVAWAPELCTQLRILASRNLCAGEIAPLLGKKPEQVRDKARKLGINLRSQRDPAVHEEDDSRQQEMWWRRQHTADLAFQAALEVAGHRRTAK